MSFFAAFAAFWKGYADFTGRSSRSAYWWVVLALVLLNIIIGIVFPGREVTLDPGSGLDPITYY